MTLFTMPLSAGISGTYLSASAAAGQFPVGRIEVLDTKSVSVGLGMILVKVGRAAKPAPPCRNAVKLL
jgi:fatty acid-binding protein DegV